MLVCAWRLRHFFMMGGRGSDEWSRTLSLEKRFREGGTSVRREKWTSFPFVAKACSYSSCCRIVNFVRNVEERLVHVTIDLRGDRLKKMISLALISRPDRLPYWSLDLADSTCLHANSKKKEQCHNHLLLVFRRPLFSSGILYLSITQKRGKRLLTADTCALATRRTKTIDASI